MQNFLRNRIIIFAFLFSLICVGSSFSQAWVPVGPGIPATDWATNLFKYKNRLFASGQGMLVKMQAWDGYKWSYILNITYPGIAYPFTMAEYKDTLYTSGGFPYIQSNWNLFKYADTAWLKAGGDLDSGTGTMKLLTYNGKLISGGSFKKAGGLVCNNVAAWDGGNWSSMGNGFNGSVYYLAEHSGQLFASGGFSASGNRKIKSFAKWDGQKWLAIDSTIKFKRMGPILSFNGKLIMGNVYDTIAGTPMYGVSAWDGLSFIPMGALTPTSTVYDFCEFNNELYLCMDFKVMKWNGSIWEQLGATFDERVISLDHFMGELFCAGFFKFCGGDKVTHVAHFVKDVGLTEYIDDFRVKIFPNPVSDKLHFENEKPVSDLHIEIRNTLGQIVFSVGKIDLQEAIDISFLNSGIYYVELGGSQGEKVFMLVKD